MADNNRPLMYARYAIGEIVLVVVGILIALQVNNLNQSKIEAKEITNYLHKIHKECVTLIKQIELQNLEVDTLLLDNERSLYLINLKNKDSLIELKETLGALGTAYNTTLNLPIFEDFLNQGFLAKVKNDSIKLEMELMSSIIEYSDRMDGYTNNQYHMSIEPYFYKHINYAEVVNKRVGLMQGGPETNYEQFFNDLELWNLLTFKSETLMSHKNVLAWTLKHIKKLDDLIVKELEIVQE